METNENKAIANAEKEKLKIVGKKLDIQKKRIELRKERLNMSDLIERKKIAFDEHKMQLEKASELRNILSEFTIDTDRTIMASEPFLAPILNGNERDVVMNKLISIVKRF